MNSSKKIKFEVDSNKCVGCGLCVNLAPDMLLLEKFKVACRNKEPIELSDRLLLKEIKECCFFDAIKLKIY